MTIGMSSRLVVRDYEFQRQQFKIQVPEMVIQGGLVTSLIGPSGSGKTTLFDILAGVVHDSLGPSLRGVFPKVAYIMHESALLPWRTVEHNYLLECRLRNETPDSARFAGLLDRFSLSQSVLTKPVKQLSFGMRQRAELARAVAL